MALRRQMAGLPRQWSSAVRRAGDPYDALAAALAVRGAPWRQGAACRGRTGVMFPALAGTGHPADYAPALALCARCPVAEPCRAAGTEEPAGVWGGTTPAMRRVRPVGR